MARTKPPVDATGQPVDPSATYVCTTGFCSGSYRQGMVAIKTGERHRGDSKGLLANPSAFAPDGVGDDLLRRLKAARINDASATAKADSEQRRRRHLAEQQGIAARIENARHERRLKAEAHRARQQEKPAGLDEHGLTAEDRRAIAILKERKQAEDDRIRVDTL